MLLAAMAFSDITSSYLSHSLARPHTKRLTLAKVALKKSAREGMGKGVVGESSDSLEWDGC